MTEWRRSSRPPACRHWHTDWQDDPSMVGMAGYEHFKQSINFIGAGLNYVW